MKTAILCLTLLSIYPSEARAIAWTDWGATTPAGNTISDNWGPISLIVKDSFLIDNLDKWYFYKHNIIGICESENGSFTTKYFIYNEYIKTLEIFQGSIKWKEQLKNRNLEPKIWTRWYSGDWDNFSLLDFIILAVILFLLRIILLIKTVKARLHIKHTRNFMILAFLSLIVIFKCLIEFPGSI